MKLKLAYYGDAILRKKGARVEHIDDALRQLIADMIETMNDHNGMGIAAPQVHQSLALFITNVPIEGPDDTWLPGIVRVFINPKILWVSEEVWECSEGCLSIPKLYGKVVRPLKVKVEYTTMDGARVTEDYEGWDARTILHENDHINGVLYVDRMKGKERQEFEVKLREIKKKYSTN